MKLNKHTLYNITELAMEKWNYEWCYKNFYLYIDNQDCWYYRIMEWTYEWDGEYTLERDNISVYTVEDLIEYIENDSLENWDYNTYENIDDLMDDVLQWETPHFIN
jgi:hypothetical protein